MKTDTEMKRADVDFTLKYSDNILCCKWYDKKAVLLLATNIGGMDTCSAVQCRMKSLSSKNPKHFPSVVKMYNKGMGNVDPMDL